MAEIDTAGPAGTRPERVTHVGLLAFLAFVPFNISAMQAAWGLAAVAWLLVLVRRGRSSRTRLPLITPVAAFFLASVLATVTATDPLASLRELREFLALVVFYIAVDQLSGRARPVWLGILAGAGTVAAIHGIFQSITEGPVYRVHGLLPHYMTYSGVLLLISVVVLARVVSRWDRRSGPWLVVALALLVTALLLTQTRSAWLGLTAGVLVVVGLCRPRWLIAVPVPVLLLALLAPGEVQDRMRSVLDPEDPTARTRFVMWKAGLGILRDQPLTGVGLEGLDHVYPDHLEGDDGYGGAPPPHLHNNVIQIAVERGVIGLVAWLWIWAAWLRLAWLAYRRAHHGPGGTAWLAAGSLGAVIGFHAAGLFEYNFGDSEVVTLLYFVMALPLLRHPTSGSTNLGERG